MACRIPILRLKNIAVQKNDWFCFAYCCNIRALLVLLDTEVFVSNLFLYPKISHILCVSFAVLLSIDPSKNSPFLLSRTELTLQISKCGSQPVPPSLVLHASLGQIRIHKARSFAGPAVSLFQQKPACLGPSMNVSNKQICTL